MIFELSVYNFIGMAASSSAEGNFYDQPKIVFYLIRHFYNARFNHMQLFTYMLINGYIHDFMIMLKAMSKGLEILQYIVFYAFYY